MIKPNEYVGKTVRFDWQGRSLIGQVVKQEPLPNTKRGDIPTCLLHVAGQSGKVLHVDLTECRCTFPNE